MLPLPICTFEFFFEKRDDCRKYNSVEKLGGSSTPDCVVVGQRGTTNYRIEGAPGIVTMNSVKFREKNGIFLRPKLVLLELLS